MWDRFREWLGQRRNWGTIAGVVLTIVIALFLSGLWIVPDRGRSWANRNEGAIAAIAASIAATVAILTLQTLKLAIRIADSEDQREEIRHLRSIRPLLSLSIEEVTRLGHSGDHFDIMIEVLNAGPGPAVNIVIAIEIADPFEGLLARNRLSRESPFTLEPNGRTQTSISWSIRGSLDATVATPVTSTHALMCRFVLEYDDLAGRSFRTTHKLDYSPDSKSAGNSFGLLLTPAEIEGPC
jgi:hypothetical protein